MCTPLATRNHHGLVRGENAPREDDWWTGGAEAAAFIDRAGKWDTAQYLWVLKGWVNVITYKVGQEEKPQEKSIYLQ